MNYGQVKSCVDFIAECVKRHGKRGLSETSFSGKLRSWELEINDRLVELFEWDANPRIGNGKSLKVADGYLKVEIVNETFSLTSDDDVGKMGQEKRLIELAMLFNGDISLSEMRL